jgi:F-type H+-transporting ATPase subunit epsilon
MRLLIATPTAVVIDERDAVAIRAEDESGSFGVLPGHTDFLTALTISVVSWRNVDGRSRHCAVRRGVLSVTGGDEVAIATREAVPGDDLDRLERVVLHEFRKRLDSEQAARTGDLELRVRVVRRIVRYLRPDKSRVMEDRT